MSTDPSLGPETVITEAVRKLITDGQRVPDLEQRIRDLEQMCRGMASNTPDPVGFACDQPTTPTRPDIPNADPSAVKITDGYEWSVRPPDYDPNIWPTYITTQETEARWRIKNYPDWDLVRRRRWVSLGEWEDVPREAPAGLAGDQTTTLQET